MSDAAAPDPLNICFSLADQSFARTKSVGIYNLSLGLLEALARHDGVRRLTALTNAESDARMPEGVATRRHDSANGGKIGRILWDQWGVYSAAKAAGAEWLLLPKGFASFVRKPPLKLATYVHDTMNEWYREHHPESVAGMESVYFHQSFKASLRHSDIILTNTDFSAVEIRRAADRFGIPAPRIVTAGLGFERTADIPAKRDRIVALTSALPHKLTSKALEWMARWSDEDNLPVDWVGSLPQGLAMPERDGWQWRPRLPEAEYRETVNSARILVFFSEHEGFGMPPVEAAIAGVCPVHSSIPATNEVMGGTGLRFDNDDYESFANAMNEAKTASAKRIQTWADDLLERHSWTKVADRVVKGMRENSAPGQP